MNRREVDRNHECDDNRDRRFAPEIDYDVMSEDPSGDDLYVDLQKKLGKTDKELHKIMASL